MRAELAGVPLAGIVLVTDGADNAPAAAERATLAAAPDVPVYTVGVGAERLARDVEMVRVDAPRSALAGGSVTADVTIAQSGLAGERARVVVEEDGRIVASRDVALPDDGARSVVRVAVPAEAEGVRRLAFRVVPVEGERITGNNARDAIVRVRRGPERILYVEGEPRFELKFVRRAVEDDEGLHVVALQRTAENKYLRLGVDDSLQLVAGFPTTREELFGYRALVLGSIEASHFTAAQLRLIADFVGERGGGLLFLGGRRSFREGGYAGTPLAEVMPVEIGEPGRGEEPEEFAEVVVGPTAAGATHALARLSETEDSSVARWRTLPPLTTVNRVRGVKPGATVLLAGDRGEGDVPVLAWQRYGRGMAAALTVQDSWLWQMDASIADDDQTHERFWRQLLRWLASDVPDRAEMAAGGGARLGAGEQAVLRATVRDSAFVGVNDASVIAIVRAPSGAEREVRLAWTGEGDGDYRATYVPGEDGVHEVRLVAERGGERLAAGDAFLRASDGAEEWFDAGMRAPLLRRLAEETGGRFYTPS
ncbi:MAG TPA: glutamine amidotransferase, partial [Gemmatimonadales bacterium]